MKAIVLLLAVVACASALTEWEEYKEKFDKQYSGREDARRYKIFTQNKALIEEHNKKFDERKVTFEMGINKFADMTTEDTSYLRGYKQVPEILMKGANVHQIEEVTAVPASIDWRESGYVTGVKDQGQCGGCWAFSATGSLEGQHFKDTGKLVSLSEQNLIDCDNTCAGCDGGNMVLAFTYIKTNGGIDTEASYPYTAKNGLTCKYTVADRGATCSSHNTVLSNSETALENAVGTVGPVSVAIDASLLSFNFYSSGVYYDSSCSSTNLDHGVLAVGYGTELGSEYWLVKNSWGDEWGEAGYIKMARNRNNNCGIATQASYPIV